MRRLNKLAEVIREWTLALRELGLRQAAQLAVIETRLLEREDAASAVVDSARDSEDLSYRTLKRGHHVFTRPCLGRCLAPALPIPIVVAVVVAPFALISRVTPFHYVKWCSGSEGQYRFGGNKNFTAICLNAGHGSYDSSE